MSATVLVCGSVFEGAEDITGPAEILVQGNRITSMVRFVNDLRDEINARLVE